MAAFGNDLDRLRMQQQGTILPRAVWNDLLDALGTGPAPEPDDAEWVSDDGGEAQVPIRRRPLLRRHPFQMFVQFEAGGTSSVEVRFYPGVLFAAEDDAGRYRSTPVTHGGDPLVWVGEVGVDAEDIPVSAFSAASSGTTKFWIQVTLADATEGSFATMATTAAAIYRQDPGEPDPTGSANEDFLPLAEIQWQTTGRWRILQHLHDNPIIAPPGAAPDPAAPDTYIPPFHPIEEAGGIWTRFQPGVVFGEVRGDEKQDPDEMWRKYFPVISSAAGDFAMDSPLARLPVRAGMLNYYWMSVPYVQDVTIVGGTGGASEVQFMNNLGTLINGHPKQVNYRMTASATVAITATTLAGHPADAEALKYIHIATIDARVVPHAVESYWHGAIDVRRPMIFGVTPLTGDTYVPTT